MRPAARRSSSPLLLVALASLLALLLLSSEAHAQSVDCVIGEWVNSGSCSQPCERGQQLQVRTNTEPVGDGAPCPTANQRTLPCNTQQCTCPDYTPQLRPSEFVLSIYGDNFRSGVVVITRSDCPQGSRAGTSVTMCSPAGGDRRNLQYPQAPVPPCEPQTCEPPLQVPTNGQLTNGGVAATGDQLSYQCNPGYVLVDASPTVRCSASGSFVSASGTAQGRCFYWPCTGVQESMAPPANGYLLGSTTSTGAQQVTLKCNSGFAISDRLKATVRCMPPADGSATFGGTVSAKGPYPTCVAIASRRLLAIHDFAAEHQASSELEPA